MAPINRTAPASNFLSIMPESRRSESRDRSEEPGSYNGDSTDGEQTRPNNHVRNNSNMTITMANQGPDSHDDILHPLREAANRVGRQVEQFAEILDKYNPLRTDDQVEKHEMVFDMVNVLHEVAVDTVENLRKVHGGRKTNNKPLEGMRKPKMRGFLNRDVEDDIDMDVDDDEEPLQLDDLQATSQEDLRHWEAEMHTWDLFKRLLEIRCPIPGAQQPQALHIHQYSSESDMYHNFLVNDDQAHEHSIVLRWLKDTANDTSEDIDELVKELQQNADRGEIISHGWIHTKGAVKLQKRINTWSNAVEPADSHVQRVQQGNKSADIVTQLDPDAPTRQQRRLENQDEFFERAVWLGCYELLRRGKSYEEIREWCADRTEMWRAVTMSGLPDFNHDSSENRVEYASTRLWRRTCHALAKRSGGDPYEKAVYGVLSGDLVSVQEVCKSWDDELFAHYNALLRTKFEKFITSIIQAPKNLGSITGNLPVFDAEQYEGDAPNLNRVIVKKLRIDPTFKAQANEPMKLIQGSLISDDLLDFICQQGLSYSKQSGNSSLIRRLPKITIANEHDTNYFKIEDHDSMRVLTHMLIALKSTNLDEWDEETTYAIENVVASYINFLRLAGMEELIPVYAAQLSEERCYDLLSRTMIDITDMVDREVQMELMFKLGLDVSRVVRLQTNNLFEEYCKKDNVNKELDFTILIKKDESQAIVKDTFGIATSRQEDVTPCRINPELLEQTIARSDLLLIRSLEWHILVEGLWSVTFRKGIELYKQFFIQGKVTAACQLHRLLSADYICFEKTSAFLGASLHIEELRNEEPVSSSLLDEDELEAKYRRNLRMRYMYSEAKSYVELEQLIVAIEAIAEVGDIITAFQSTSDLQARKNYRRELLKAMNHLRPCMGHLLHPLWLKTSTEPEPLFASIRAAYLPAIILAFNHILHLCGSMLSRDNYLECLNLATFVAEAKNDLDELFTKGGKMRELVDAFADDSLALLMSSTDDRGFGTVNNKLKALGWKRSIWDVGGRKERSTAWDGIDEREVAQT